MWTHELQEPLASQRRRYPVHLREKALNDVLVVLVSYVLMQDVEVVLLSVVDGVLIAIEVVKSTSLRLQEKAHDQAQHQSVQFLVLVKRPLVALCLVEVVLAYPDSPLLLRFDRLGLLELSTRQG